MTIKPYWVRRAACARVVTSPDNDLFFPEGDDPSSVAAALAYCRECDARPECLEYALETAQPHGIWGGYSEPELRRLIASARAGRTRGRRSHFNAGKECCKRGHPFTDANTHYTPDGKRQCRTCLRAAWRRSYERGRS